jgi:hypothetical protein
LRNGVGNLPPAQQLTTARIAIAFVGDEVSGPRPWTPPPAWSWDMNSLQDRFQLGTVMSLSCRDHHRERASLAVAGYVELGRESASAAPESFVARVLDPLVYW